MKLEVLIIIFCLVGCKVNAQVEIKTDSSTIELTKNSVYRVWEETFKYKDSVFYSVSFISDTTQLSSEGWMTKNGQYFGVWKEFNEDGQLLYKRDYDKIACKKNLTLYPYHNLMSNIKLKADSLIINTYGQEFFDNHVRFNFNCKAYKGKWVEFIYGPEQQWYLDYLGSDAEEGYWESAYLGSWTEPVKSIPNSFHIYYDVKLNSRWYLDMIGINLDSLGNYRPIQDRWNNFGFEKVETNGTFSIDKEQAISIASQHGLKTDKETEISEFLIWEKFNEAKFHDGQFRYYITELYDRIEYKEGINRQGVIFKFNVYVFNPWTNDFIEKKKMKSRKEWGENSGHTTGLRPDNE